MIGFDRLGKNGRFGNQMFQYAALKGIARKNNYDFEIIVILDKNDIETFNSIKDLNCKVIWQSKKGYGNAII